MQRLAPRRRRLDRELRGRDVRLKDGKGPRYPATLLGAPELDQLVTHLTERFSGRAQRRGPSETARKAVTKVLRTQIGKLLELHPVLGRHLRDSLRMGTTCVYAPPSAVEWDVGFGPK